MRGSRRRLKGSRSGSVTTGSPEPVGKTDAELIAEVRGGATAAYETLYERHVAAANNLARQLARSQADADDLVAEAFMRVLDTLRAGKGPDAAFRAYLLTAVRHTAYDKTTKDRRVELHEDMSELGGDLAVPFSDTVVEGLERSLAATAFARLPERWQAVLWHTEIEGQPHAEIGPLFGLTPSGVSGLAGRAREGLRQAYLQVHVGNTTAGPCRPTAARLGAWARGALSDRERIDVERHIDECEQCRSCAAELADVGSAMRAVIAPLVLGPAALGYLASARSAEAAAQTSAIATAGHAAGRESSHVARLAVAAGASLAIAAAVTVAIRSEGTQPFRRAVESRPAGPAPTTSAPAQSRSAPPAQPPPPPPPSTITPPTKTVPGAAKPRTTPSTTSTPRTPPPETTSRAPQAQPPAKQHVMPPPTTDPVVEVPAGGINLTAGCEPRDVAVKVRNDGRTRSAPVDFTLSLPRGIVAAEAVGRSKTAARCSAASAEFRCRTPDGMEPDQSVTFVLEFAANQDARMGKLGLVVAVARLTAKTMDVPLRVAAPMVGVDLHTQRPGTQTAEDDHGWLIEVTVENTGQSTRPARGTVGCKAVILLLPYRAQLTCSVHAQMTIWFSNNALTPGEELPVCVVLTGRPRDGLISFSAALGTAHVTETTSSRDHRGATEDLTKSCRSARAAARPSRGCRRSSQTLSERVAVPLRPTGAVKLLRALSSKLSKAPSITPSPVADVAADRRRRHTANLHQRAHS
jgi:RNA polymerase sigma factor (sigma-70 family)